MLRGTKNTLVRKASLRVEQLESRLVPYSVSGNAWPHPELVTLSFMPDGTQLGGGTSSLFSTMDAKWATSVWQRELLRAAQVWAQNTNLNFTLVADDGSISGSGSYQQGAANFGDVRIGAMNMGSSLGSAYMPPPVNNYSIAGDYNLNSTQNWVINQAGGYDLFTVATHEMGHTLGLYHSTVSAAQMFSFYNALKNNLRSDDISGIRAIYSAGAGRAQDSYDAIASNGSFATATNVVPTIAGDLTSLIQNLDLTSLGDHDYYSVVVPADTTGTMVVKVQSAGLSMAMPLVKLYDAAQVEVGSATGLGQYGSTLTVTLSGVTAGQQYFIKVSPAELTAFGTGKYAMTMNFGNAPNPTVPLPDTMTAVGNPISGGGGQAQRGEDDHDHGNGCCCPACAGAAAQATDSGAAGVVQVLTESATLQTVETRHEALATLPATSQVVDAVFAETREVEATRELPTAAATASAFDLVFADLFV